MINNLSITTGGESRETIHQALAAQGDEHAFTWALMKLTTIGHISGVSWKLEYAATPDQIAVLSRSYMTMTEKGVARAQELSDTGKKRANEAVKVIGEIFRDLGIAAFPGMIIH